MPEHSLRGLSEFSSSFAEPFLRNFHDLREQASVDKGVLTVEVSPRPVRAGCVLYVSTADDEVTVGFGNFHTHFVWPPLTPGNLWENPIEFIRALTRDEIAIVDFLRDGTWTRSTTLSADEASGPIEVEPGLTACVRSWSGSLDRTIFAGR